ncbi:L-fucose kinase isoform X1 [Hydra vulgaris]|uniref:L-fucose kinase isoform X1 n=2 Tax=Hydra vulgaris TaxID=6087 RepID=UPI001F5E7823|nr:L-fucose kinase isoform X1 [Hydra vulgaris]
MNRKWSAIVITCSDPDSAQSFQKEVEIRQQKMLIDPETIILCVVDPRPNIGSGGATLNAILHITEHISALQGYTVISSDVLQNKHILIVHMGLSTPYTACSPAFISLPAFIENVDNTGAKFSSLATLFDIFLLMAVNIISKDSPAGFWVCNCDRMLILSPSLKVDWSCGNSVYMFSVPVDIDIVAKKHGVIKISDKNEVEDIIYKGTEEDLQSCKLKDGKVPAVCGLVFLNTEIANILLNLCVVPPLENCTYLGLDAGYAETKNRTFISDAEDFYRADSYIVLSLFFDLLLCMCLNIKEEDYIKGKRSGVYGTVHFPDLEKVDNDLRQQARQILYKSLNGMTMKAVVLREVFFYYISNNPAAMHSLLLNCPYQAAVEHSQASSEWQNTSVKIIKNRFAERLLAKVPENIQDDKVERIVIINSIVNVVAVGENSVFLHTSLDSEVSIGQRCMLVNISSTDFENLTTPLQLPSGMVLERFFLKLNDTSSSTTALVMFGLNDDLQKSLVFEGTTIFNQPWGSLFERTGILPSELWSPDIAENKRCMLNARLYPVYSPKDKLDISYLLWLQGKYTSHKMAARWRCCWRLSLLEILDLADPVEELTWRSNLQFQIGKKKVISDLLAKSNTCLLPFFRSAVLEGYFDKLLACLDKVAIRTKDSAVLSRTFACIADVLGVKAGGKGGLRSGPASNYYWKHSFDLLQKELVTEAVESMAVQRKLWFSRPDLLVRAARHYEGAFQLQVRKAVATAKQFVRVVQKEPIPMNVWVTSRAPGRLDIAGGWSDTPPICYEQGGLVVSLGIMIDEKKPIGCRIKRVSELDITLIIGEENPIKIVCKEFEDLMDYAQPNVPGALLKAAFFCSEILCLQSTESLSSFLSRQHGGGFVLQTWSDLPHGSGLGASSILAGVVIAAMWTVTGLSYDVESVLHAVLYLEQMLTTGGGWQDQVGGLYPSVKVGSSKCELPLQVKVEEVNTPAGFLKKLEKHLLVVFTGKTRLARNLLQDVLRNWNARNPEIVYTASELVKNAERSIEAFQNGDLAGIGACLNEYWKQKKLMAHGCEPNVVRTIMDVLQPYVYGQSLAGAGGGGFLYLITKEENMLDKVREELNKIELIQGRATAHAVQIDMEGLVVDVDRLD